MAKYIFDCLYQHKTKYMVKIKAESLEQAKEILEKQDFPVQWLHRLQESTEILSIKENSKIED